MKITVYTIPDCQFSRQEKEYLASHTLMYEEKNLETNKEFLTEMLAVSNNFAGTPVTKIEKDDGQIVVLKGFTKKEFDKALGFDLSAEVSTKAETVAPAEAPAPPAVAEPPTNNPLNSVLNTLEQKSEAETTVTPPTAPVPTIPTPPTVMPETPVEPTTTPPAPPLTTETSPAPSSSTPSTAA